MDVVGEEVLFIIEALAIEGEDLLSMWKARLC